MAVRFVLIKRELNDLRTVTAVAFHKLIVASFTAGFGHAIMSTMSSYPDVVVCVYCGEASTLVSTSKYSPLNMDVRKASGINKCCVFSTIICCYLAIMSAPLLYFCRDFGG